MRFHIITIFPKIFDSYFNESILARARKNKFIEINIHNLRDYTTDKRKTVDDTPYGGGVGMVLKVEPIYKVVLAIKKPKTKNQKLVLEMHRGPKPQTKNKKTRALLFSAKGKRFTQNDARRLAKYDRLIMICGRYEGVDERVAQHIADEEISIGDYVLTGGELPAMVIVDAVSRLIPDVVGKEKSIQDESFKKMVKKDSKFKIHFPGTLKIPNSGYLEYPHYTRPEIFSPDDGKTAWRVPKVLLSGNHKKIKEWREKHSGKTSSDSFA